MLNTPFKRPSTYRGRFAPSPSGPLHFGSLVTALASYIHAKQHQGLWLVRIEDIDPPREQPGASSLILKTLEAYGLHWDEDILYQSTQSNKYSAILADLARVQKTYHCTCTRAQIKAVGGIYQGHCRHLAQPEKNAAIRIKNEVGIAQFTDLIQGEITCDVALAKEDFTLKRKDGLFAYQLAVVHDDIEQNISHIIRGCDLLEPTARQLTFYKILNKPAPLFGHVPLVITPEGYKLSKQNKAPAIDNQKPQPALIAALNFLGQQTPPELLHQSVEQIISWAIQYVDFSLLHGKQEIILHDQ